MQRGRLFAIVILVFASPGVALAESFDWPQWRGSDRTAVSQERGLLKEWPTDGPALAWKIKGIGGGYSGPSIAAGRIYGMSNRGSDEFVWCLNETDGKEVWATNLGPALREGLPQGREGAGCTPTIDGKLLYVIGLGGDLACLQVADGKVVWRLNLTKDFDGRVPTWRYNESPLIDGDKLICTPGGKETTLAAVDKLTGKVLWKSQVPEVPRTTPEGSGGGRGGPPELISSQPVLLAIDADRNKEISTEELAAAPAALEKLDKNKDGKLVDDELRPEPDPKAKPDRKADEFGDKSEPGKKPGGRGGPGGGMRFMPFLAALDADRNSEIDAAEIKNAAAVLKKLDANSDGKLVEDEVRPRFGGGRGGRGGGGGSGAGYASAIAIDFQGQRQYVQLTAKSLVGVAATDGKLLWRYDRAANTAGINCSTPLFQDGVVFAASAYGNGGGAVKLSKDASGQITPGEVYFSTRMQNHHGGMIIHDGCLYGAGGGNSGGFLVCLDFQTGKELWSERKAPKGSLALADGRLYLRTERGAVHLIEPSREKYVERGRFDQPDRSQSPAWTHPVLANGKLYIRDQDVLYCYQVKGP